MTQYLESSAMGVWHVIRSLCGVLAGSVVGTIGGAVMWPMSWVMYWLFGEVLTGWWAYLIGGGVVGGVLGLIAVGVRGSWGLLLFAIFGGVFVGGSAGSTAGLAVWRLAYLGHWIFGYPEPDMNAWTKAIQIPVAVGCALLLAWDFDMKKLAQPNHKLR